MSRWNTRQINSDALIKFCQILPKSIKFRQIPPTRSNSTKFHWRDRIWSKPIKTRVGLCPRVCCQDPEYLVTSFLYFFLFFTQRLVLRKSYIPLDLDRIYIVPSNLPRSLFAPSQTVSSSGAYIRHKRPIRAKYSIPLCLGLLILYRVHASRSHAYYI